jgi:hypothetical protein
LAIENAECAVQPCELTITEAILSILKYIEKKQIVKRNRQHGNPQNLIKIMSCPDQQEITGRYRKIGSTSEISDSTLS